MTKKEIAEAILQNSSLSGVSERQFYNGVKKIKKDRLSFMLRYINRSPNSIEDANYYSNCILAEGAEL